MLAMLAALKSTVAALEALAGHWGGDTARVVIAAEEAIAQAEGTPLPAAVRMSWRVAVNYRTAATCCATRYVGVNACNAEEALRLVAPWK